MADWKVYRLGHGEVAAIKTSLPRSWSEKRRVLETEKQAISQLVERAMTDFRQAYRKTPECIACNPGQLPLVTAALKAQKRKGIALKLNGGCAAYELWLLLPT